MYVPDNYYLCCFDLILSQDNKLLGFGSPDLVPSERFLRPMFNARNAVVKGQLNAVNPTKDTFAAVAASGMATGIYWYLTESWEEF